MGSISRRSFLGAGVAGAGLAATSMVSRSGLVSAARAALSATASATTSPSRSVTASLERGWEFYQGPMDGPWEVWHSEDLASWQAVAMPHCFNQYDGCDPDVPAYRGVGWYRTHLHVADPLPGGRTVLLFEGAGQTTTVYVGQTEVGTHVGGYDEFCFDITDAVAAAQQTGGPGKPIPLAVRCDNGRDLQRMPSDLSDFTLYGGLYRHVSLLYLPAIAIERVHVLTEWKPGDAPHKATVHVRARLFAFPGIAAATNLSLQVRVLDPTGRVFGTASTTLEPGSDETELCAFDAVQPFLWSPDKPALYRCEVTATTEHGISTVAESFGIRHAEFREHGPFFLNGQRLPLRGTHRHEDHAGFAAAVPDDVTRSEMQLIKDMGVNFIRLAHYQQSRLVLQLCDELGILVWEELTWCRSGIAGEPFKQMGRDKLRIMIDQHRNHPSIILWGLGNEDDWPTEYPSIDQAAIRAYMSELQDLAHTLDDSRVTSIRRCDFARDIPDVYSPSIWAGWYSGRYTDYQAKLEKERGRVKRLLHVEFGADSHAGRHAENPYAVLGATPPTTGPSSPALDYTRVPADAKIPRDGDWSETYACDLFDWHLKTLETLPWLSGAAMWIFKDFTTPLRVENPVPRINQKGVVTRDGMPKESYFVFQSYWAAAPMVHIYGHTWPIRWGEPGQSRLVRVYSNCDSAELFLNGVSQGAKQRESQNFPCAGLRWELPFRPGENTLRVVATRGGTQVSDSVTFVYQTDRWAAAAQLHLMESHRDQDTVSVEAILLDAAGVRCLDARTRIRYSLAGDGRLLDNRGTPTGSRVVEMCNGRSSISVAFTPGRRGPLTLGVTAAGVTPAFLPIGVQ